MDINDLTEEQATDLARYHLGPDACAWRSKLFYFVGPSSTHYHLGPDWRIAFFKCGIRLPGDRPSPREFVNVGRRVLHHAKPVAACTSNSMAERIANALNAYKTGRRGT